MTAPDDARWDGRRWWRTTTDGRHLWWDGARWQPYSTPPAALASPAASTPDVAADPWSVPATPTSSSAGRTGHRRTGVAIGVVLVLAVAAAVVVRVTRDSPDGPEGSADPALVAGPVASAADVLPDEALELTDETRVVRGNGGATVLDSAIDGTSLTLDASVDGVADLEPGDVLLLTGITVVKVAGVEREGSRVVVTTGPAAITDVVRNGELVWDDVRTGPGSVHVWEAEVEELDADDGSTTAGTSTSTSSSTSSTSTSSTSTTIAVQPSAATSGAAPPTGAVPVRWQDEPRDEGELDEPRDEGELDEPGDPGEPQDEGELDEVEEEPPPSLTGTIGDARYSVSKGKKGNRHTLHATLSIGGQAEDNPTESSGGLALLFTTDASVGPASTSGSMSLKDGEVSAAELGLTGFEGDVSVKVEAGTGSKIASRKQNFAVPVSWDFPVEISGIPFNINYELALLVQIEFTTKDSTLTATLKGSFRGDGTVRVDKGSVKGSGSMTASAEDTIDSVEQLGIGSSAMVVAVRMPKVGIGLGFAKAHVGVFFDYVLSGGITAAGPLAVVDCKAITITDQIRTGLEGKLFGKEVTIGKPVDLFKKSVSSYVPHVPACR